MTNDGWDISKNLKWSYFFFDKNKEKLMELFEEIKDRNYIWVKTSLEAQF